MKLRKVLTVGGEVRQLVSEDIRLSLRSPGRAIFQVRASSALSGQVQFSVGYSNQDTNVLWFTGYVDSSNTVDGFQQRLMCRELTAALYDAHPLSLRHPTMGEVILAYAKSTGLNFVVPEKDYATKRVPCFQTLGNGFLGLATLGDIFGVGNYIWQQQGDGAVFVGSWDDSRWASRGVKIPEKWFTRVMADGSKVLPVIPQLRPGVQLNGMYLTKVQLVGHEMVTKCANTLSE